MEKKLERPIDKLCYNGSMKIHMGKWYVNTEFGPKYYVNFWDRPAPDPSHKGNIHNLNLIWCLPWSKGASGGGLSKFIYKIHRFLG